MKRIASIAAVLAIACSSFAQEVRDVLRVDVDLVQVYATITDVEGRYVIDLKPEHFRVLEDGVEQKIQTFSSDDVPLSIGIVVDVGSGVKQHLDVAKEAIGVFLMAGNVKNEYFLIESNDESAVTIDFTKDVARLKNHAGFMPSRRDKVILDAAYEGLEKLKDASNPNRLLLVITAGGDTKSRHNAAQVRELGRQLDVQIYGISPPIELDLHALEAPIIAPDLIESMGGQGFMAGPGFEFQYLSKRIAVAVRNQYAIGYRSSNPARDGKFRKLQVKLQLPTGFPELFVQTRSGYYAPAPLGGH